MNAGLRSAVAAATAHPWRTVAAFAVVAAYARFAASLGHPVPWIFGDEFIYVENARNFAEHGTFAVRDQRLYLSFVTTVLDAPGFLLFGDTESAYVWIKAVNSLVMVSAAFPAFALARMVVSTRVALAFTALVLAWPAYAYVQVVMTEPAFLAAAMLAIWALARAVEQPTRRRQCVAMATVALCLGVRLQAVVFLVAIPVICVVAAWLGDERSPGWLRRLRRLSPLIAFAVALPVLAATVQVARGRPVRDLLGGYEGNDAGRIDIAEALPWLVRHLAVVGLALAIVPAAIAVSTFCRFLRRGGTPAQTGVLSVAMVLAPLLIIQVAVYASVYSLRVVERNLFVVEPLLLLVALAGICAIGYSRVIAIAASCGFALVAVALPVDDLLRPPPFSDTFSLLAVMKLSDHLHVDPATLIRGVGALAVLLTVVAVLNSRRRVLMGIASILLVLLAWSSFEVTRLLRWYSSNVANVLQPRPFDWVDRAVGPGVRVALLWPADDTPTWVWQHEIWNRSIRSIVAIDGAMPVLETKKGSFSRATGVYVPATPADLPPETMILAPSRWRLEGAEVARARTVAIGLTLWRASEPLRLKFLATGIYADGWSGKTSELYAYACRRGSFKVGFLRGFGSRQQVIVSASGKSPVTVTLDSPRSKRFVFPALPDPVTGTCTLTLDVQQTATGDEVSGNGDPRVLGAHILSPTFDPGPGAK